MGTGQANIARPVVVVVEWSGVSPAVAAWATTAPVVSRMVQEQHSACWLGVNQD